MELEDRIALFFEEPLLEFLGISINFKVVQIITFRLQVHDLKLHQLLKPRVLLI